MAHMCAITKMCHGTPLVVVERLSIYGFDSIKQSLMWWFDLSTPGLSIPGLWYDVLSVSRLFGTMNRAATLLLIIIIA